MVSSGLHSPLQPAVITTHPIRQSKQHIYCYIKTHVINTHCMLYITHVADTPQSDLSEYSTNTSQTQCNCKQTGTAYTKSVLPHKYEQHSELRNQVFQQVPCCMTSCSMQSDLRTCLTSVIMLCVTIGAVHCYIVIITLSVVQSQCCYCVFTTHVDTCSIKGTSPTARACINMCFGREGKTRGGGGGGGHRGSKCSLRTNGRGALQTAVLLQLPLTYEVVRA